MAEAAVGDSIPCSCMPGGPPCPRCHGESGTLIRRKSRGRSSTPAGAADLSLGAGRPLGGVERSFFEARYDTDLADVRVHDNDSAAAAAAQIDARAFTFGPRIAFARGEYRPHTAEGRLLLAHELAHVMQASDRPVIRREPLPPASSWGEFDAGDPAVLQSFIESIRADPGLTGQTFAPRRSPFFRQEFGRFGETWDWQPPTGRSQCPGGACHQVAEGFARAGAERQLQARQAALLERWGEMHATQHEAQLGQQARTLTEDLQTSDLISAQMRIQLLDRTIGGVTPEESLWAQMGRPGVITTQMRDTWVKAQQAIMILDTLLAPPGDQEIGGEAAMPLREAFIAFYASLTVAQRDRDQREARLDAWRREHPPAERCPGGCHALAAPDRPSLPLDFPPSGSLLQTLPASPFTRLTTPPTPAFDWPAGPGARETRLTAASGEVRSATGEAAWRRVMQDFRWATKEMDTLLLEQVPRDDVTRPLIEQFNYTRALLERQQRFQLEHPDAVKIQAIFYPRGDVDFGPDETGMKCQAIAARGIPWQFYLVHTPVPNENLIPADFEWQLHDLTAPNRKERYVKSSYQIGAVENYVRSMRDPRPITQTDPPRALFEKLDHSDFFPEGMLYWRYPHSGRVDQLETTEPWTFIDWLTAIGMAVAILGSLVFAPFSTPMLISVGLGTAMSITGRALRLREMEEHGVLTESDVSRFYWDVALDLVSALTLGLGRVALGARAVNSVRAASLARGWFLLKRAELGLDIVNVGVVAHDFVQQYDAILRSDLPADKKQEALQRLTMFAVGAGLMTTIPVYTGLRDIRHGATLMIDIDPANPRALIGSMVDEAAEAATGGTRGQARLLRRAGYVNEAGERHTVGLWSDGRITRCSEPPCEQLVDSVVGRIDELRTRMRTDSAVLPDVQALLVRARQLREEAVAAAAESATKLASKQADLVARARQLESEMDDIALRVARESPLQGGSGAGVRPDPRAIRQEIDALLHPGANMPDAPRRADVDAAVRRFELGHPLPGDFQMIVSDAVAEVRAYLTLGSGGITPSACAGMCSFAKGQLPLTVLGRLERSGVAVQVDAMSATALTSIATRRAGIDPGGASHQFVVVRVQGEGGFIVDPTFSQFLRRGSADVRQAQDVLAPGLLDTPAGAAFTRSLVMQGFVPLTRENAALYSRALGLDLGPVGSLEPGPVARLILSGEQHYSNIRLVAGAGSVRFVDVTEGPAGTPLAGKALETRENMIANLEKPSDLISWYERALREHPVPAGPAEREALERLRRRLDELRALMPRYQTPGHPWAD